MKRHLTACLFAALCAGSFAACADEPGLLGVRVPVGSGTVTASAPYVISEVFEDGPAYAAGVRPDDVILEIDGTPIAGMRYQDVYERYLIGKVGTRVTLTVMRDGKRLAMTMIRIRASVKQ